eukprot:1633286-Pleurochrysis_carterae.AAC.9
MIARKTSKVISKSPESVPAGVATNPELSCMKQHSAVRYLKPKTKGHRPGGDARMPRFPKFTLLHIKSKLEELSSRDGIHCIMTRSVLRASLISDNLTSADCETVIGGDAKQLACHQ